MIGIIGALLVVSAVVFFMMQPPPSTAVTEELQQLEAWLWTSYVDFSIAKQNELYALHLDEATRMTVVETHELPEALVEAIHTFHATLNDEMASIEQYRDTLTQPEHREIVALFIVYLEARNTFLNKEWGYTRALLKQQQHASVATRLYRHARNQQSAAYEAFALAIDKRTKKRNITNRFQQS